MHAARVAQAVLAPGIFGGGGTRCLVHEQAGLTAMMPVVRYNDQAADPDRKWTSFQLDHRREWPLRSMGRQPRLLHAQHCPRFTRIWGIGRFDKAHDRKKR